MASHIPPDTVHIGRPHALLEYQRQGLLNYLNERPTAYLEEMQYFLWDYYQVEIAPRTIYDYLAEAHWSRKVVTKHARERSELYVPCGELIS